VSVVRSFNSVPALETPCKRLGERLSNGMSIELCSWVVGRRRIKTPRSKFEHCQYLLSRQMKPMHDLVDAGPVLQVAKHDRSRCPTPRNTQAPLRLPGMLPTAGHCDQSRLAMRCTPLLGYAPDNRQAGSRLRQTAHRPRSRALGYDFVQPGFGF